MKVGKQTTNSAPQAREQPKEAREIVVRLKTEMLSIGSGFISRMHMLEKMPGAERGAPPALTQIGNTAPIMLSPYSLRGWLRHGVESYLIGQGIEVCHPVHEGAHPSRVNEATGKMFVQEDLEYGYHPQGKCFEKDKEGCLVAQLFGSLRRPSAFMQKQVIAHPIKSQRSLLSGIGGGFYRMVQVSPTTRSPLGTRAPFRTYGTDILAFVDIPWRLAIRPNVRIERAKVFMGLFVRTFDYLDEHREDFFHQLGGKRNMGCGIVRTAMVNPLYGELELVKLLKAPAKPKKKEEAGDADEGEPGLVEDEDEVAESDQTRPQGLGLNKELDEQWDRLRMDCLDALDVELGKQRATFPYKPAVN